jgi:hypothetical protein
MCLADARYIVTLGLSSLAMDWARARLAVHAPANAAYPSPPLKEAVAPVNRMLPRLKGGGGGFRAEGLPRI